MKKVSVIIPVFNEEKTIAEVVKRIQAVSIFGLEREIIVVDNNSLDGTLKILGKTPGIKFLVEKNRGKGLAIRNGLKQATGDILVIQDADLEYSPEDYPALLKPIIEHQAEIVYGSRFKDKHFKMAPYYIVNKFLTVFSNFFTGLKLTDMETCYKCFKRESINDILPHLQAKHFNIEPEITAVAAALKFKIEEVPISYHRRSKKEGKKIGWVDGLEAIWTIIACGFRTNYTLD